MMRGRPLPLWPLTLIILSGMLFAPRAGAAEVWTGRTYFFNKPPFAVPLNAADQISPLVWITRGSSQGIYNPRMESGYVHSVSPKGTEWATGDAINHAGLTFEPWEIWAASDPPTTVGVNACVHLIAEDIYIDIAFSSWGVGGTGGYFSYYRAQAPVVPTARTTWGRIKKLYR